MSKELYTKRLAEVLGVTDRNMKAAIAVVDAEFEAAEKVEIARAETPIEAGEKTSDKFDSPLTPEELEQLDTDSHNEDEAAFSDADQSTVESDDAEADKY
jgi:hypothetical protein